MKEKELIDYKIRAAYAGMRKSEKKVADYVLLYLGYDCHFCLIWGN